MSDVAAVATVVVAVATGIVETEAAGFVVGTEFVVDGVAAVVPVLVVTAVPVLKHHRQSATYT